MKETPQKIAQRERLREANRKRKLKVKRGPNGYPLVSSPPTGPNGFPAHVPYDPTHAPYQEGKK